MSLSVCNTLTGYTVFFFFHVKEQYPPQTGQLPPCAKVPPGAAAAPSTVPEQTRAQHPRHVTNVTNLAKGYKFCWAPPYPGQAADL